MKTTPKTKKDELRKEYLLDYSKAVRGKYYKRLQREGSNVVLLDEDVAKRFRSSEAVNDALRSLIELSDKTRRVMSRPSGRS